MIMNCLQLAGHIAVLETIYMMTLSSYFYRTLYKEGEEWVVIDRKTTRR